MQLTTKIIEVEQLQKGEYKLKLKLIEAVCDTIKLHRSLKNREITLIREFSDAAPEPEKGELVILDKVETRRVLEEFVPTVEYPAAELGKAVSKTADFNSDCYDELYMSNAIMEAMISPKRGALIQHLASVGENGLVENEVIQGVMARHACGMQFDSVGKGFGISEANFKISKSYREDQRDDRISIPLRAKVSGLKTVIEVSLFGDQPAISYNLRIKNSGKKAKAKKVAPIFRMRFRSTGYSNSDMICLQPDGVEKRFVKHIQIPVWEWCHEWYMYIGDVRTEDSGFLVIQRQDTGESLLVSFQPGQVKQVWQNSGAYLPEVLILARPKQIAKNKTFDFDISLCPIQNFRIANGYFAGYIEKNEGYHAISAGPRPRNFVIDGKEVTSNRIGPTLYHIKLDKKPREISLTGDFEALKI